ncbi:hypothetical protein BOTNAR_0434g00020 [Botryotinia narcissicola]|uniref:Uncharacterized protein n=1 Tax=Botryotinia narcissicola TaxID=278944 RepID=A0A4Z1HX34_9HELO|nr:hypothetical protein BOTNAR_0434g00020 [Botryotinia narcissicola]
MFRRERRNEGKLVLLKSQIEIPILGKYLFSVEQVSPKEAFKNFKMAQDEWEIVRPLKWIGDCPRVVGVDLAWPVRRSKLA